MAKAKIQSAGGIGESKMFGGTPHPEGTGVDRIQKCHINGVLIGELNLDPAVLGALDYFSTDEGIQERNSRPNVREASGIRLGADGFDKSLEQRRDDVRERDMELYEARDPLKEVADKYAVPGMKAKFLSAKRIQENRGTGDYEVVKDATGEPVKVRGMVLGHVPVAMAKSRNRHFRGKSETLLKQIKEKYMAEGGKTAVADQ
jgi:hypothetical protein